LANKSKKIKRLATQKEYEKLKKKNYRNIPEGYTSESYWMMMDFLFEKQQLYVWVREEG
jgi:hypothetical protein